MIHFNFEKNFRPPDTNKIFSIRPLDTEWKFWNQPPDMKKIFRPPDTDSIFEINLQIRIQIFLNQPPDMVSNFLNQPPDTEKFY